MSSICGVGCYNNRWLFFLLCPLMMVVRKTDFVNMSGLNSLNMEISWNIEPLASHIMASPSQVNLR